MSVRRTCRITAGGTRRFVEEPPNKKQTHPPPLPPPSELEYWLRETAPSLARATKEEAIDCLTFLAGRFGVGSGKMNRLHPKMT